MSKENRVSDELAAEIAARWPEEKIALFRAVTSENLNDGNYINAYHLTDRLYEAVLRFKPVAGFEVQPLEWDGNIGRAGTAFRYVIAEPDRTIGWRVWISIGDQSPSFFLTAKPENREDAVSFAEADYRQRILSILSLPAQEPVASAREEIIAYILQDDLHNRLTPRIVDVAYTAFMRARDTNDEDGGSTDWFTDTKPIVDEAIAKIRQDLTAGLKGA